MPTCIYSESGECQSAVGRITAREGAEQADNSEHVEGEQSSRPASILKSKHLNSPSSTLPKDSGLDTWAFDSLTRRFYAH